ncbi:hypothetical protein DMH25_35550 [Streptomyces sp. WAC 01325]|nr:hypothetical protein DMH25_35550 [Streptomyces sp. WAC 01325]
MTCCCGTHAPSRSHCVRARASVSIAANCTGPHAAPSPAARLCACTALDFATHSFHTHRTRPHSTSRAERAVDDKRTR